jgi:hypothetical protein
LHCTSAPALTSAPHIDVMINEEDITKAFWIAGTPELYPEPADVSGIIPDECIEIVKFIRSLGIVSSSSMHKSVVKTDKEFNR